MCIRDRNGGSLFGAGGGQAEETMAAAENRDSKIERIETLIRQRFLYDVDTDELEEYIYKGIMAGLGDPYSAYYTEEEFAEDVYKRQSA